MDPSLRRRRIIHENNLERNKRFQLPAFPTANQILWHCSNSQSALRPKSGRNEHKRERVFIRPNFSRTTTTLLTMTRSELQCRRRRRELRNFVVVLKFPNKTSRTSCLCFSKTFYLLLQQK